MKAPEGDEGAFWWNSRWNLNLKENFGSGISRNFEQPVVAFFFFSFFSCRHRLKIDENMRQRMEWCRSNDWNKMLKSFFIQKQ